ncbi:MAG: nitrile hydratase subunit alpha [Chloroflexi bacterium]|nr:nitrile hydratase subunit alpha [Chloroflexota bacterium]
MTQQPRQHSPTTHEPIGWNEPDVAYLKKQVLALITLLRQKGVFTYPEFLAEVHRLETSSHDTGARVVAHAWTDPTFKERLLDNGKAAVAELGIDVGGYDELQVVENTDCIHNVVVCTTCSCTPAPLHGLTPDWYKSTAYRTRVVQEPREVLGEFGLELPDTVEVRVIDTDVRRRCLVLPKRPPLSSGLSEDELAALVTQESLFGVGEARGPVGA